MRIRAGWLLLTLLIGWPGRGLGQAPDALTLALDSLKTVLRRPHLPDSVRISALLNLGALSTDHDMGTARRYLQQALDYSRERHDRRGELAALGNMAYLEIYAENYLEATRRYQSLLRRAEQIPRIGDKYVAEACTQLANIARAQDDYQAGEPYLLQGEAWINAHPRIPFDVRKTNAGTRIMFYTDLLQRAERPSVAADSSCARAERAIRSLNDLSHRDPLKLFYLGAQGTCAYGASQVATYRHQPDSALARLHRAAGLFHQGGIVGMEASCLSLLVRYHQKAGQPAEAVRLSERALALAEATGQPRLLTEVYRARALALAALGKHAVAYEAAHRALVLTDSLLPAEKRAAINRLEVQFGTERKEGRIRELSQQHRLEVAKVARQRQRLWGLGALLATVLLGLGVALVLYRRLRQQGHQLAAQNAALARQRDELTQARATQDSLYALVAHDLRGPVVAFAGLADMLRYYQRREQYDEIDQLAGEVRQAAQGLSELLDNLLNWAVSQRGELVPRPRPLRAEELLAEMTTLYHHAATAAQVTLVTEAAPDLTIQADPDMARTILRNLTGNALKATPAGGRVVLRAASASDGRAELRVVDSGPGLAAEQLARLNAAVPALRVAGLSSGAGLGLRLSRSFAEAQGGSLVLVAAAAGGLEAVVTLPQAA